MTTVSSGQVWTARQGAYRAAVQRRVLSVLTAAQVMGGIGVGLGVAAAAPIARELSGSEAIGVLAQASPVLGAALLAVPSARLSAERGRRAALAFGYGTGAIGALVTVIAVAADVWALFLAGLLFLGGGAAAGYAARYTATDLSRPGHAARDLSIIVWAATGGSVMGPLLAGHTDAVGGRLGVYILAAVVFVLAALGILAGLRPDPLQVAQMGGTRKEAPPDLSLRTGLRVLGGSPSARLSVAALVVGHTAMLAMMVAAPVHLDRGGAGPETIGVVLGLHVAGMYALSPLVGWFADQFGHVPTLLGGQLLLVVAAFVAGLADQGSVTQVAVGLVLLGLGWSCGIVAGSALLTESVPVELRPSVQGLSDLLMNGSAALGGLLAGTIVAVLSYAALSALLILPALPMAALLLFARRLAHQA